MPEQRLDRETAQTVALRAVTYLASDEDRWRALLLQTGLDAETVRGSLHQSGFLRQIVAFLMQNEKWAAEFCIAIGGDEALLWRVQRGLEDDAH
ncbi:MAG: hypothetical protein Tsb0016_03720 [Sphingomonadales bacterium]